MHFALVKQIWGPFFDHFVDLQILTIWGQRSGSDPQPKKIGSQPKKIGSQPNKNRIPSPIIIYLNRNNTNKNRGGTFLRLGFDIRIGPGSGPQPNNNRF